MALPLNEWLSISEGAAVWKLVLAYFGEDEEGLPIEPHLRFTVVHDGRFHEIVLWGSVLEIAGHSDNTRQYNIQGTHLQRNDAGQWCAVGKAVVRFYNPKASSKSGTLMLHELSWRPGFVI